MTNQDTLLKHALLVAAVGYAEIIERNPEASLQAQFLAKIIRTNVHADQVNRSVEYLRNEFKAKWVGP